MANQTIPITLTAGPVPPTFEAADINQLMQAIATYIAGAIRADVSFYLEVLFDPANFVTNLIYNSNQRVFKYWNTEQGKYVAITQFITGDVKQTYVGTDQVADGWVLLDGRAITAITGLTFSQRVVLETFFGIGQNIPTVDSEGTPTRYTLMFVGF